MAGTWGKGVWRWVERVGKEGSGESDIWLPVSKWTNYRESLVTWLWPRICQKAQVRHLEMDLTGQLTNDPSIPLGAPTSRLCHQSLRPSILFSQSLTPRMSHCVLFLYGNFNEELLSWTNRVVEWEKSTQSCHGILTSLLAGCVSFLIYKTETVIPPPQDY